MKVHSLAGFMLRVACLTLSHHVDARPVIDVKSATNRDGSALRVKSITEDDIKRSVWIYFRKPGQSHMQLVANFSRNISNNMPSGLTTIVDWDRNGTHEISIVKECGAGPNCTGDLFHIEPQTARMIRIFEGNTSFIEYLNGHLVEYGRSSCCSWEASVYKVSTDRLNISAQPKFHVSMAIRESAPNGPYSITSKPSDTQKDGKSKEAVYCQFFKTTPAGNTVIKSPPGFMRLCDYYRPFSD
jgi:hypothetical protein